MQVIFGISLRGMSKLLRTQLRCWRHWWERLDLVSHERVLFIAVRNRLLILDDCLMVNCLAQIFVNVLFRVLLLSLQRHLTAIVIKTRDTKQAATHLLVNTGSKAYVLRVLDAGNSFSTIIIGDFRASNDLWHLGQIFYVLIGLVDVLRLQQSILLMCYLIFQLQEGLVLLILLLRKVLMIQIVGLMYRIWGFI